MHKSLEILNYKNNYNTNLKSRKETFFEIDFYDNRTYKSFVAEIRKKLLDLHLDPDLRIK